MKGVVMACPYCAEQQESGYGTQVAVGLMVASPYLVVGTVLFVLLRRVLKNGHREEETK